MKSQDRVSKQSKQQAQKANIKQLVDFMIQNPQATMRNCTAAGFSQSFLATFYILALRRARSEERQGGS